MLKAGLRVQGVLALSFLDRLLVPPSAETNPFLELHGGKSGCRHAGDAEP